MDGIFSPQCSVIRTLARREASCPGSRSRLAHTALRPCVPPLWVQTGLSGQPGILDQTTSSTGRARDCYSRCLGFDSQVVFQRPWKGHSPETREHTSGSRLLPPPHLLNIASPGSRWEAGFGNVEATCAARGYRPCRDARALRPRRTAFPGRRAFRGARATGVTIGTEAAARGHGVGRQPATFFAPPTRGPIACGRPSCGRLLPGHGRSIRDECSGVHWQEYQR